MPIATPTTPVAAANDNNTHSVLPSGSYTPTANSLQIAVACALNASLGAEAHAGFDSTFGISGSWSTVVASALGGSGLLQVIVGVARASASPGAGVVNSNWGGLGNGGPENLLMIEVASGFDPVNPVRLSNVGSAVLASGDTITGTSPQTPAAASLLIGGVLGGDDNFGADNILPLLASAWTKLESFDFSGTRRPGVFYAPGTSGTTYGARFENAHDCSTGLAAAFIEIVEPSASTPANQVPRPQPQINRRKTGRYMRTMAGLLIPRPGILVPSW